MHSDLKKIRTVSLLLGSIVVTTCALTAPSRATIYTFAASLDGASETPPNASPGTGSATVFFDTILNAMTVIESFSGLTAPAVAAHIHCCTPPGTNVIVAVPFPAFPNATSGTYNQTFDMTLASSYNAAFITANGGTVSSAEAALLAGMLAGTAYVNIHNANFPGGEIRGFLQDVTTPLPAALPLFASGLGVMGLFGWRRRRKGSAAPDR